MHSSRDSGILYPCCSRLLLLQQQLLLLLQLGGALNRRQGKDGLQPQIGGPLGAPQ